MQLSTPVSIRLQESQRAELKKRANELGVSETVAIKLAVALFLSKNKTESDFNITNCQKSE